MATPLKQYLLNEASSGTAPASFLDSAASPANLAITYAGGYAWTTDNTGKAIALGSGAGKGLNSSVGSVINALNGSKTVSLEIVVQFSSVAAAGIGPIAAFTSDGTDIIGIDWRDITTGASGTAGPQVYYNTVADGDQEETGAAFTVSGGYYVVQCVIDTAATNRKTYYSNGFQAATSNSLITANTTILFGSGTVEIEVAIGPTSNWTGATQSYAAFYATALTPADALSNALFLFGDSDHDPNAATAKLRQAGTNGGTNAGSTSTANQTVAPTQTVAASGNNRGLFALITGLTVTTGVTACTFNGVTGTKLTQQTSTASSDAEIWWWNDAALPSSAGTYSASITVDGATGTACATLHYDEGISQNAPTNFGLATGTGTSITATLTSSATAGSVLHGVLFDITVGDAAIDAANQLPISIVNGTSTGNTHRQITSAKYIPTSGANSMSWSGLTNATTKIAVVVESLVAASGPTINTQPSNVNTYVGNTATFTVSATTSGGTLTYQWKVNGSNVSTGSGGTTASYTTAALAGSDNNNSYTCVVTDNNGSVTSSAAILMLYIVPALMWFRA